MARPSLTTVEQSQYDMGHKAAELILEIIKSRGDSSYTPPEKVLVNAEIIYRESTNG